MPFGWSMLARVTSQKPRRPQFVRIAQVLRLAAGQRDQPCPGLGSDRRLLARPGTIVERRHWTVGQRPLNAALDRLMMHPQSLTHRKEREVPPVSQQHSRSLDPARRLRSRACYRNEPRQILFSDRQLNRSSPCRHDLRISSRESKEQPTGRPRPNESLTKDRFHGIDGLVKARKQAGVTQTELAAQLRRPQSFVAKYEGRERRLDVAEYLMIARALGADPYKLLRVAERG